MFCAWTVTPVTLSATRASARATVTPGILKFTWEVPIGTGVGIAETAGIATLTVAAAMFQRMPAVRGCIATEIAAVLRATVGLDVGVTALADTATAAVVREAVAVVCGVTAFIATATVAVVKF
jgi:hypothetical protein